jgi:hypothetical protein
MTTHTPQRPLETPEPLDIPQHRRAAAGVMEGKRRYPLHPETAVRLPAEGPRARKISA